MALVVMCGQPCGGKSTAAACPSGSSTSPPSTLAATRATPVDTTLEKNLRGVLRSEVDSSVSKDSIIVVDSLNNIKGYRYELWCLARAAGIRYCVIYCDTGDDQCREWNNQHQENSQSSYDTKIFEDLVRRFERPDRRNRWDSPLFELFPSKDEIDKSPPVIAEVVSYLTRKVDSKTRDVKVLQPTIATSTVRSTEVNTLYEMDTATQEVINVIVEAQSQSLGGIMSRISVGKHLPIIDI